MDLLEVFCDAGFAIVSPVFSPTMTLVASAIFGVFFLKQS